MAGIDNQDRGDILSPNEADLRESYLMQRQRVLWNSTEYRPVIDFALSGLYSMCLFIAEKQSRIRHSTVNVNNKGSNNDRD